ncbi:MAG: AAA family ATPase [Actinobacteria bacterium]|nr:AAA family ATPase [Actinomycetota bacterium]
MLLKHININYFKGLDSIELKDCGNVNVIVGKNNSGKSTILHAIKMAELALNIGNWEEFQPKINIEDLFSNKGKIKINLTYMDDSKIQISPTNDNYKYRPINTPRPNKNQKFKSILIQPSLSTGLITRTHQSPKQIVEHIKRDEYSEVNLIDILYAINYYSTRNEWGFIPKDYNYKKLISEIKHYFPEIENIESDRTEEDILTLNYEEYGKKLDIIYSGTGLLHFLEVLLKIIVSKANIVLFDEPESALHPDLQRQFIEFLHRISKEKDIQFFLATHSQVLLNYVDLVTIYRITNKKGKREVSQISKDAAYTILSDLGLRASDIFNQDICILLEGQSDVIFFEHIIRTLYEKEFNNIAVAILQYGGSAAEGIISERIEVSNIVPAQKYIFWIHDRDAKPSEKPASNATKFKNSIEKNNEFKCHIWKKREIEYYYPECIHVKAQQNDKDKEEATLKVLNGDQGQKYYKAAEGKNICVPKGNYLRNLLKENLNSKDELDEEIREIVEKLLIPWKKEILGEE